MNRVEFLSELAQFPAVAILRGITPAEAVPVCVELVRAGFRLIEIPLNSPEALRSISLVAEADCGCRIGAGTVLTPWETCAVAAAGAEFVISPDTNIAVIRAAQAAGLVTIPGFMTPTEAFQAVSAGADVLKCFPAGRLGPAYLKDLRAVLPTPVLAVGGVDSGNAGEWLEVADGIGVGSSLYRPGMTPAEVAAAAKSFQLKK